MDIDSAAICKFTSGNMLVPPAQFGLAEEGVYQSSYIDPINYSFIQTLSLRSILLLDVEKPPKALYRFLLKNGIQLYQISNQKVHIKGKKGSGFDEDVVFKNFEEDRIEASTCDELAADDIRKFEKDVKYLYNSTARNDESWMVMKPDLLSKIFQILLNKNCHDLLIVDATNVVVSLLRKIEKWTYSGLISEYRMYANKNKTFKLENFLEIVSIELIAFEDKEESETESPKVESAAMSSTGSLSLLRSWSPRDIAGSLQKVSSFKSQESYDNSYKSTLPSVVDRFDTEGSSSPQIPNNLLKLVEMRKKSNQGSLDSVPTKLDVNSVSHSQNSSQLTSEFAQINLLDQGHDKQKFQDDLPYYHLYYKPLLTDHYEAINNHIKIRLPPEDCLPEWFTFQRNLWIQEYKQLNKTQ